MLINYVLSIVQLPDAIVAYSPNNGPLSMEIEKKILTENHVTWFFHFSNASWGKKILHYFGQRSLEDS